MGGAGNGGGAGIGSSGVPFVAAPVPFFDGASRTETFWRVFFPLSLPGVAAGGLLVFIVALGFFITPALLGGPKQMMISNLIEFSVRQVLNWPFAFALANVLLCGTLLLYFAYIRVLEGRLPKAGFP